MSAPIKAEVAALAKAKESLAAAKQLSQQFSEFSASRAYYAMFYAATALLLSKGLTFKRHSAVIAAFGREFAREDADWRDHHKHLVRAEALRLEGDYDLYAEIIAEDVAMVLAWAEAFVKDVEGYLEVGG